MTLQYTFVLLIVCGYDYKKQYSRTTVGRVDSAQSSPECRIAENVQKPIIAPFLAAAAMAEASCYREALIYEYRRISFESRPILMFTKMPRKSSNRNFCRLPVHSV